MLIEVTQQDIDKANKRKCNKVSSDKCIIANTFKRYFPGKKVSVSINDYYIEGDSHYKALPKEVITFIIDWLLDNEIKPFTFNLNKDM